MVLTSTTLPPTFVLKLLRFKRFVDGPRFKASILIHHTRLQPIGVDSLYTLVDVRPVLRQCWSPIFCRRSCDGQALQEGDPLKHKLFVLTWVCQYQQTGRISFTNSKQTLFCRNALTTATTMKIGTQMRVSTVNIMPVRSM